MEINSLVEQELHKIHRTRNRIGFVPNILFLLGSIYFQNDNLLFDLRWFAAMALVSLGTIMRLLVGEFFSKEPGNEYKWVRTLGDLGLLLLAIGWGLHFSDVYYHYGPLSPNVTYTLLILVAFITGASTILVASGFSFYVFVGTISGSVIITYLLDPSFGSSHILFNIVLYTIFSVGHHRLAKKQLRSLIETQIRSHLEKERLEYIIDTVPGFVGILDKDLVCRMTNKSTLALFPDVLGKKVGTIDPTSNWEQFIIDCMASPKKRDVSEQHTFFKGRKMHALMNVLKTDDGGAIVVSLDTTELVEAETRLREQEAKALYSAKLASLGEMAAGIAHEINNPLAIIQGAAHVLKRIIGRDPIDTENAKVLTSRIIDTTERISKTVKSLKTLSRNGEKDQMVAVSVPQLINICKDLSEHRFKVSEIDLRIQENIPDIRVMGREVQLSQVLVNLLSNAVDAVQGLQEKWVEVRVSDLNPCAEILVMDSGRGIRKDIQDKIMEPFFTTKDVNQGTGLGLSISKTIIKDHGGDLLYVPTEERTTFRIRLPIC